jgi:hypothetical protein
MRLVGRKLDPNRRNQVRSPGFLAVSGRQSPVAVQSAIIAAFGIGNIFHNSDPFARKGIDIFQNLVNLYPIGFLDALDAWGPWQNRTAGGQTA